MSEIQFARGKQADSGSNSIVDGKISFTTDDRILYIDYLENGEVKREPVQSLTVNGHTVNCDVPSNAKFTDTTYELGDFGITVSASEINKLNELTVTTVELNYMDGVTSNVQTQLNSKAPSSHDHSASNIIDGILSLSRGGTGGSSAETARISLGALNLISSESEPISQNVGDLWFKEV